MTTLSAAFLAGVAASVSPCDYPLIPVVIGFVSSEAGQRRRSRILVFALGQALALVALGLFAVSAGDTLGASSENPFVRRLMGLVLLLAAAFSWFEKLPKLLGKWNQAATKILNHKKGGMFWAFLFGMGGSLLVSPCTSPILGSVLMLMATDTTLIDGLTMMSFYALGFTSLFLLFGLGVLRLGNLPKSGRWLKRVHNVGALIMFSAGIYFLV